MARIFEYDVGREALGQLLFKLRRKINKLRQIFRSTESKLDILKILYERINKFSKKPEVL